MSLQVVVNFRVVDESPDWLVVDKPAPLIVHPANHQAEPTLLGGVEQLLAYEIHNGARPAVVNRLDRDTSGLVVVAKHTAAARALGIAFMQGEVHKEYLAIVRGWPQADAWTSHDPILRAGELGPSSIWVRRIVHPAGQPCTTKFEVAQRFLTTHGPHALVRCFPATGRTHQIRVHLAHAGHPVLGDKLYGTDGSDYLEWMAHGWTPELAARLVLPRHALHAARLDVPWNDGRLAWDAPLARDLEDFIAGREPVVSPDVVIWTRGVRLPHA